MDSGEPGEHFANLPKFLARRSVVSLGMGASRDASSG